MDSLREGIIVKTAMYASLSCFLDSLTELVKVGTKALKTELEKKAGR